MYTCQSSIKAADILRDFNGTVILLARVAKNSQKSIVTKTHAFRADWFLEHRRRTDGHD
jgi:hypothetical protein